MVRPIWPWEGISICFIHGETKYREKAWKEVRKDRRLRKYADADGNTWIDVITGEVSLIDQPLGAVRGIADVSLPKQ